MREFLLQLFLDQPVAPVHQPVAPVHHLAEEAGIVDRVEVAAATQHEGLIKGVIQPEVSLLGDAVFVGFPGIDQCGAQVIVIQ